MADNKLAPPSKNKLPWYEQALSMEGRAAFLPYQDTLPGSVMNQRSFALPGIIAGAANAITAPGRAYSGSDPMFDPQEEAANFALNMMGGGMGASRAAPAPAGSLGMHTWHGSPHRFPPTAKNPLGEFDPMKIGTGEGAQSYGVGAGYLAENRTTGQTYNPNPGIASAAWDRSMKYWTDKLARNDNPVVAAKEIAILKEKLANQTGYIYKVDLPDVQIAKMLDWDKPLSQQPEIVNTFRQRTSVDIPLGKGRAVQPVPRFWYHNPRGRGFDAEGGIASYNLGREGTELSSMFKEPPKGFVYLSPTPFGSDAVMVDITKLDTSKMRLTGQSEGFAVYGDSIPRTAYATSGKDLYGLISHDLGGDPRAASKTLSEYGIPGIRYLDQGSRTGGAGTSNFVVFDPAHMDILERNGVTAASLRAK